MCQSSPYQGLAFFLSSFILSVFIAHPFYWHSCTVNKSIFVPILKITVLFSLIKQWLQCNPLCYCCLVVKPMENVTCIIKCSHASFCSLGVFWYFLNSDKDLWSTSFVCFCASGYRKYTTEWWQRYARNLPGDGLHTGQEEMVRALLIN